MPTAPPARLEYGPVRNVCRELARLLGVHANEVFPSSTGIIGVPLPVEKIVSTLPELMAARSATKQGIADFARAIMTTDTRPKLACATFRSGKSAVNLLGIAKGAGMIHPHLATMLVYVFTDIAASPADLKLLITNCCEQTFNCISIDGDTSTNDTVLLLASGRSGVRLKQPATRKDFSDALLKVCQSLAEQIVFDGEGVKHVIHLSVEQARNREEAAAGGADRRAFITGEDRMGGRGPELGTDSGCGGKVGHCP